jgi:glycine cleavage system aminomethyltransferase T
VFTNEKGGIIDDTVITKVISYLRISERVQQAELAKLKYWGQQAEK